MLCNVACCEIECSFACRRANCHAVYMEDKVTCVYPGQSLLLLPCFVSGICKRAWLGVGRGWQGVEAVVIQGRQVTEISLEHCLGDLPFRRTATSSSVTIDRGVCQYSGLWWACCMKLCSFAGHIFYSSFITTQGNERGNVGHLNCMTLVCILYFFSCHWLQEILCSKRKICSPVVVWQRC